MPDRQRGFTLIAALITLVVLGIGLLGLAQLQARLWAASADLHASDDAQLLADNTLEKFRIAQTIDGNSIADYGVETGRSATHFKVDLALSRREQLTEARVHVDWQRRSESRSLRLAGAIYTASQASDSRLLLAVD